MRTLDCVSRRGTGQVWLQDDFRAQRARLLGSVHWLTRMRLIHHPNPASARKSAAYSRSSNNGGHGALCSTRSTLRQEKRIPASLLWLGGQVAIWTFLSGPLLVVVSGRWVAAVSGRSAIGFATATRSLASDTLRLRASPGMTSRH